MASTIIPYGPEFQININSGGNNGISGAQDLANLAVLTDGRFVVTYQSDFFGSATDTDPIVAIFYASGTTFLAYRDAFSAGGHQKVSAVAARLDGGFGMVFQNDRHANGTVDSNGPNITYVPVSAAGGLLSPIGVADFNSGSGHDALQNAAIATLSSGRQVVAFERVWTADVDHDVFLNVVNAAGTLTQFSIANPLDVQANASWQANPTVAATGNSALVVFEDGTGTTTGSANIRGRIFDGGANTLGAAFTIADHTARLRTADVAAIGDDLYAVVYGDQNDVFVRIVDTNPGTLFSAVQVDTAGGFALNPAIARLPGGRFVVTWAEWNGADYDARARLFDSNGTAMGSGFIVTSLTDNSQFTPDVTVSGTRVLFAWTDFAARPEDSAAPGIRGRIFSVNDPPNDFNDDGRSDILLQNVNTGDVYIWELNGTSLVAHGGVGWTPGAAWQARDTGDYNGDGKADVLLQNVNTGDCFIWELNGTSLVGSGAVGWSPGVAWRARDGGDFNDDGNSDILLQDVNTGACYIWELDGTSLVDHGGVGWTPGAAWQAKATGDFNGDGKSDIVLQNVDTGDVYIWELNGTSLVGDGAVGWTPGAAWQVKTAGDYNGDGKSDILLQNVNTGDCYIWELEGTNLLGHGPAGWTPGAAWEAKDGGDFNGDGKSDILLQNATTGDAYMWLMNGTTVGGHGPAGWTPGADWHIL